jgi:hypothetical protein
MWARWFSIRLRNCATNRKVTGSIPDGVIGIFLLTQPLTEMSKHKAKAIPLQALTRPECSRRLRLPYFKKIGK